MSWRSPEEQTLRQCLNIIQNCWTSCRISRNTFKPSVYDCKLSSPDDIGKHAENKWKKPSQDNSDKAIFQTHLWRISDKDKRKESDQSSQNTADQKRRKAWVHPIYDGHDNRQQHKQGTDQQCPAHIKGYRFQIHSLSSFRFLTRCLSSIFSSIISKTPAFISARWSSPSIT